MNLKQMIFGNETDKMPNWVFRLMEGLFKIFYFFKPAEKYIEQFGIVPGTNVIDYGCGPGAFIRSASLKVGESGHVFAVDIHEMAILSVNKIISKHKLTNVTAVLSNGFTADIKDNTADLIFALDMFHMVKDSTTFLKELRRISKVGSVLIIEDGHQPRKKSKEKIIRSGFWEISEERKRFLKCKAKQI